jgi:hypothetical protein
MRPAVPDTYQVQDRFFGRRASQSWGRVTDPALGDSAGSRMELNQKRPGHAYVYYTGVDPSLRAQVMAASCRAWQRSEFVDPVVDRA